MPIPNFSMIKRAQLVDTARTIYGLAKANGVDVEPSLTKDNIDMVPGADGEQWNLDYAAEDGRVYRVEVNVAATESIQRWADVIRELREFYGIPNPLALTMSVERYLNLPTPKIGYVIENPPAPTTRVGKLVLKADAQYFGINGVAQIGEVIVEGGKAYQCVPFNAQLGGEVERGFGRAWKLLS